LIVCELVFLLCQSGSETTTAVEKNSQMIPTTTQPVRTIPSLTPLRPLAALERACPPTVIIH
jgi:hypothetical protein